MVLVRADTLKHDLHRFILSATTAGSLRVLVWFEGAIELFALRAAHAIKADVVVAHLIAGKVEGVFVYLSGAGVAVKLASVNLQSCTFEATNFWV